jgi:hypothetical protein
MHVVEIARASVKIPRRQGRSKGSDQAVFKNTVRERAERERSMRGISTMHETIVCAPADLWYDRGSNFLEFKPTRDY